MSSSDNCQNQHTCNQITHKIMNTLITLISPQIKHHSTSTVINIAVNILAEFYARKASVYIFVLYTIGRQVQDGKFTRNNFSIINVKLRHF